MYVPRRDLIPLKSRMRLQANPCEDFPPQASNQQTNIAYSLLYPKGCIFTYIVFDKCWMETTEVQSGCGCLARNISSSWSNLVISCKGYKHSNNSETFKCVYFTIVWNVTNYFQIRVQQCYALGSFYLLHPEPFIVNWISSQQSRRRRLTSIFTKAECINKLFTHLHFVLYPTSLINEASKLSIS